MTDNPCTICGELEDIIELLDTRDTPFNLDGEIIMWDRVLSQAEVQLLHRYPYNPSSLELEYRNHKRICNVRRQYRWLMN